MKIIIKLMALMLVVTLVACSDGGRKSVAATAIDDYLAHLSDQNTDNTKSIVGKCFRSKVDSADHSQRCYTLEMVDYLFRKTLASAVRKKRLDLKDMRTWLDGLQSATASLHSRHTFTKFGASMDVGKWENWAYEYYRLRSSSFESVIKARMR